MNVHVAKKRLERNIPLMYAIACLVWGRFFIPVLALFYIASQVSLEQFTLIMGVFALSNFLLEVPTGIIADLIGNKKTLLIGRFCYVVEVFILAFFNGFLPFLIAKIVSGVGVSFVSGANEAFTYNTLKKLGRENDHKKFSGNMFMLTNACMAVVFIIGAYLFSLNYKLPAYASLPLITLGFVLTGFLHEPYKSRRRLTVASSFIQLKEGLVCIRRHFIIRYLILFSLLIIPILDITMSVSSAYFEKILIPVSWIGGIAFCASMISAGVGRNMHRFEEKIGDKQSLLLIQILLVAALLLMSLLVPYYGVVFYFLIPVASGFFYVLTNHYMNTHVDTTHRATVLSIQHLCNNLAIFLAWPLFGFFIKKSAISGAFFGFGLIFLTGSLFLFWYGACIKTGELGNN